MKIEKISVIIPIYNVENYLNECIHSILNQTYKNIELILVDDGSTDKSFEICQIWSKKDKRIKLLHQKNSGASAARNIGLKIASGEYISFIDSDDFINDHMYEKMISRMKETKADICICGYNDIFENRIKKHVYKNIPDDFSPQFFIKHLDDSDKYKGYVWNKLFSKNILQGIYFDETLSILEDMEYICRISSKIKKCTVVNEPLYNYVQRSSSVLHYHPKVNFSSLVATNKIIKLYENIGIDTKKRKENYIFTLKLKQMQAIMAKENIDNLEVIELQKQEKKYKQELKMQYSNFKFYFIMLKIEFKYLLAKVKRKLKQIIKNKI